MLLAHPYWLLLLLLLPLPWFFLRRKGYVGYSDLRLVHGVSGNVFLHKLPLFLFSVAYALVLIGLARPQIPHYQTTRVIRTRDIILGVDISGSMGSPFAGEVPKRTVKVPDLEKDLPARPKVKTLEDRYPSDSNSPDKGHRRIDAAQGAILRFVENRFALKSGDRVGVVAFDTSPHWLWPLTDDLKIIWRNGLFIDEGLGGGTNFGEYYPGPIDAAAEHFDEMGKSTTKVFILVTDGEDNLSSSALSRLAGVIKSHNIHFYVIGVGETLGRQDSTADIFRLTEMVGGHVYRVENAQDLSQCFDTINGMEQTRVEVESKTVQYQELFFYFVMAAGAVFGLGLLSEILIVSQ
jgi:Mg-chelatase subunit ChlD